MTTFKALSLGTKLVLVAGPLLFVSLFFTWQNLEVDYGPAGTAVLPQDGWDSWGLLAAVLTLAAVGLVVLRHLTEVELREDVRWDAVTAGLGVTTFLVLALKNATDADSSLSSYVFLALAGVLAAGGCLVWAETRGDDTPLLGRDEREVSPTA